MMTLATLPALAERGPRGRVTAPPTMVAPAPAHDRTTLLYEVYDPHGRETVFLATHALAPTTSAELFRVDHAESYPPRAAASPDGAHIAMTRLPPGARRDAPAELVLVDPASRARRTVATDAHYFTTPIVSSDAVFYVRQSLAPEDPSGGVRQVEIALVRHDLASRSSRVLYEATLVDLALLGVASESGELIALRRAPASAEVVAFHAGSGALRSVARAALGRDLLRASLDTSGRFVLLTELAPGAADAELTKASIRGATSERLRPAPAGASPAWLAGDLIVQASGAELELDQAGATRTLGAPRPGASQAALVGLSADGRFAVARWLDGATQVYQIIDASNGAMTALPPPSGGDLFGMNADVVGFVQPRASSGSGDGR